MRAVTRISFVVTVAVISMAATPPQPEFRVELRSPDGGSEMSLLDIGRPSESGSSEVRAGVGPRGVRQELHYSVNEFEVLSIHDNSVVLRFRLRRFKRPLILDQATQRMWNAGKEPWHKITFVPGQPVSVPVYGGEPLVMNGSIVNE
jgi:hypothetical protein